MIIFSLCFSIFFDSQDFAMSDFSPILVLQIKICIKPDRYGKGSKKNEKLIPSG